MGKLKTQELSSSLHQKEQLVQTAILLATKHQLDNDNWVTDDFYTRAAVLVRRILKMG